jgi:hypothetical protein
MRDRELRRRCERILGDLDAAADLDIRQLCDHVGQRQGKPIHLVAESLPTGSPSGLTVRTGAFDAIIYERNTSPLHQTHIIGHELGHVLCGHQNAPVIDADASRLLLPNLDPALVQSVLGRTNYTAVQEREAEMIASLILRREAIRTSAPAPVTDPRVAPLLNRLEHTLEDADRKPHG